MFSSSINDNQGSTMGQLTNTVANSSVVAPLVEWVQGPYNQNFELKGELIKKEKYLINRLAQWQNSQMRNYLDAQRKIAINMKYEQEKFNETQLKLNKTIEMHRQLDLQKAHLLERCQ